MPEFRMNRVVWCDRGWQLVHFGFVPSEAAWAHHLRQYQRIPDQYPYEGGVARTTAFAATDTHSPCAVVTVREASDEVFARLPWELAGVMAHEAVHVWRIMCDQMGETKAGEEIDAYAIQHIAAALMHGYAMTRGKGVKRKWQKVQPAKGASRPQKAAAKASRPRKAATR